MAGRKVVLLLAGIITGPLLVPVNSTMIAIGLPTIAASLGESLKNTAWVITVYLIVMACAQPIAGKCGDLLGHKRVFLSGLVLFLVASVASVFTTNLGLLILFRSIQALGGALTVPTSTAIIRLVLPPERIGRVLGLVSFCMGMGAAIGPMVGSALISAYGWTSVFWINIPFLLISFLLSIIAIPPLPKRSQAALDFPGLLYMVIGMSLLVLLVKHPEWISLLTLFGLLTVMTLFVRQELASREPLVDLLLFRQRLFLGANLSILLNNLIMYSTILLFPILLGKHFAMDLRAVGGYLFLFSLSLSVASWMGAYLEEQIGNRQTLMLSFALLFLFTLLSLGLAPGSSAWYLGGLLMVGGIGSGIGLAAMQKSLLTVVEKEKAGMASGVFSTFRYLGGMLASVLVGYFSGVATFFLILSAAAVLGLFITAMTRRVQDSIHPSA